MSLIFLLVSVEILKEFLIMMKTPPASFSQYVLLLLLDNSNREVL